MIVKSHTSSIVKSILGFSLPTWINAAIGILAVPLVTRLFPPDMLGKFNLFNTYCTILSCVALAGLNQGYMRFCHEPPGRNTDGGLFKLCLSLVIVMTLFVSAVIVIFGNRISNAIAGESSSITILCLIVYVAAACILNMINSSYRMRKLVVAYGLLTILMNICAKLTYAGAVFSNNKYNSMIVLFTASYTSLAVVFGLITCSRYKNERVFWSKKEITPLLTYSIPLMPILFISQINTAIPKLSIAKYLDYSQVGIYASAYSIVSIISIVQSGINVFWTPFVFENFDEHRERLSSGHVLITFVMVTFGLVVILFQDVIYSIVGPAYQASQKFFALLLFSPICYTISETTGIGINISKNTYLNFIVYGITIAITFTLCWLLLPKIGLIGAATSVAVAAVAMLIVKSLIGERYYRVITSPMKTIVPLALISMVIILNTLLFDLLLYRVTITFVAIVVLCIFCKNELVYLLHMVIEFVKNKSQKE